jgi:hypothetical protein
MGSSAGFPQLLLRDACFGNQNFRERSRGAGLRNRLRLCSGHKYRQKIGAGMSSSTNRKPEFRLHLGYPYVTLTREDEGEPLCRAAPDRPGFAAALREIAAEVARQRGRVSVVLPAGEVWRGELEARGRSPIDRMQAARASIAADLGVAPADLVVVLGPEAASGALPAAAVRRTTLAETLALLASTGIRPAAVHGEGGFPGFAEPPRLAGSWRIALAAVSRRRQAAALGAGAVTAATAVAALLLTLPAAPPSVEVTPPAAPAPVVLAAAAPATPAAEPAGVPPKPAPALRLARSEPPLPRPAVAPPLMQAARVTMATRNLPLLEIRPRTTDDGAMRLAELTAARVRMTDAIALPMQRPPAVEVAVAAPAEVPIEADGPRPLHRPGAAAAKATTAAVVVRPADPARPLPRPGAAEAVVAALAPAAAARIVDAVGGPQPLARPARAAGATPAQAVRSVVAAAPKPQPVRAAPAQPVRVAAAPQRVATAPKNVVMRAAPTAQLRVAPKPAPARVVRVAPQPVRVAAVPQRVAPAPKPQRVASAPRQAPQAERSARRTTTQTGISRGNMALIGVFGQESGRHALIRLPNGKMQRVRAGDSVQGVQVAAVGTDSVRLTGRGRDTLLKLPD